MVESNPSSFAKSISDSEYVRKRISPRLKDMDYITLCDLRDVILEYSPYAKGRLLDYGCGGSPYKSLFKNVEGYLRADVSGVGLDLIIPEDGILDIPSASLDFILSTQVLEHVKDPGQYISEAFRILKPGGFLLLTTHGLFPEHGCPYDFYRWTPEGLIALMESRGFHVKHAGKISSGNRGIFQWLNFCLGSLRSEEKGVAWLIFGVVRKIHAHFLLPFLNWIADFLPSANFSEKDASGIYVGVGALAIKKG